MKAPDHTNGKHSILGPSARWSLNPNLRPKESRTVPSNNLTSSSRPNIGRLAWREARLTDSLPSESLPDKTDQEGRRANGGKSGRIAHECCYVVGDPLHRYMVAFEISISPEMLGLGTVRYVLVSGPV